MKNKIIESKWLRWSYGLIFGIIFNFILDVIYSLVYLNYNLFQPISHYLVSILLTYLIFSFLFQVNSRLDNKYSWEISPYIRFFTQFSLNSVIAVIIVVGLHLGLSLFFGTNNYIRLLDELILTGLIILIVFVYTVLELSIFLMVSWRYSLAELERFKKENAEIKFESLRSQLNPHFLFNSLNTLSSLIFENQENAGLFIRELSDVYRYILENRDSEMVSIEKELSFAGAYIHLNQLRFDKNLIISNDTMDADNKLNIAPLTLQLLIENAIKHNVISKKNPLKIGIKIDNDILEVRNNLQPKESKEYSNNMGLNNIVSRYQFLTERQVEVLNTSDEFIVKIPLL